MAKIVARTQKLKMGNLNGLGSHVDRSFKGHSNPDIDTSRSDQNYDLVDRDKTIHKDILDYIEDRKTSSRAIRKDAVLCNDWVITSSQDFFKDLDQEETKRFFESSKNYFAERFGSENIRYAVVHLDETTPHMHMGIVPFDQENKLAAKRVFDKKTLLEIQEDLPKFLKKQGFEIERGEQGSDRKHLDTPEFKKLQKELEVAKSQLAKKEKELEKVSQYKHKKHKPYDKKAPEKTLTGKEKIDYSEYEKAVNDSNVVREKYINSINTIGAKETIINQQQTTIQSLQEELKEIKALDPHVQLAQLQMQFQYQMHQKNLKLEQLKKTQEEVLQENKDFSELNKSLEVQLNNAQYDLETSNIVLERASQELVGGFSQREDGFKFLFEKVFRMEADSMNKLDSFKQIFDFKKPFGKEVLKALNKMKYSLSLPQEAIKAITKLFNKVLGHDRTL